jgi:hypothetical protein
VYTLVLGLGGWLGAILVAAAWFPAVPLDSLALAVASIGVPVGLGVHWASIDRSSAVRGRALLVLAGAVAGAFAGYHASTGLLAVVTTIVGAALGANVVAIVLDIVGAPRTVAAPEPASSAPVPA